VAGSNEDASALGERVRDTAMRVTMTHGDQYRYAQQQVGNYPSQRNSPNRPKLPGHNPPQGSPDDSADGVRAYARLMRD
jgi:hypothetical protein